MDTNTVKTCGIVCRNLLGWTCDTGTYLSTTMAAMTLFGAPSEKYTTHSRRKYK